MLSEAELLPTIAEVSVAYAGFASLIGVFASISSREQVSANLFRLRDMLETSVMTLAFSLVPFLPTKFGASNETSWRMAALGFSVLVIVRLAYKIFADGPPQSINRLVAWLITGVQIFVSLLLLVATFLLSLNMVVGAYYLLLFVVLLTSAHSFLRVAFSALAGGEAEP